MQAANANKETIDSSVFIDKYLLLIMFLIVTNTWDVFEISQPSNEYIVSVFSDLTA